MQRTKIYKRCWLIASAISLFLTAFPMLFFTIKAFATTGVLENKLALCGTLVVVAMATAVCVLVQYKPRSLLWIILIALWLSLDNLGAVIITFTVTQCLDEFVVCPIKKWSHRIYMINREIDKR